MSWRRSPVIRASAVLIVLAGLVFVLGSLGNGPTSADSLVPSTLPPQERDALDQLTRNQIAQMSARLAYHPLLPTVLPTGFTYAHLSWDGDPHHGFNLFVSSAGQSRAIHLLEGRGPVPAGSKDTKIAFAASLKPATIAGTEWLAMQKPDEPWRGSWIFVTDTRGFRLEVDGLAPPAVLEEFIRSLS